MPERLPNGRFPPGNGQQWGAGQWGASRWGGANGPGKGPEALHPVARTREVLARMAKLKVLLIPHLDAVAQTWVEIMLDPNAPPAARIHAAEKIAERVEGKVKNEMDVTTAGEKLPGAFLVAPPEPESPEAWETAHTPQTGV